MKLLRTFILVGLVLMVASTAAWARYSKWTIINSDHDLRSRFGAPSFAICNFCHVVHKTGPAPEGPGPLLWNHTASSVASYGVYQSGSLDATDISDLGGKVTSSNLCLSCHDGTVAINSFYSNFGANLTPATFMPEDRTIRDLTKQHPINFTFDAALAAKDGGLITPASVKSVDPGGEVPLYNGTMQCSTCHDPHAGPPNHIFFRQFPAETGRPTSCLYCHR